MLDTRAVKVVVVLIPMLAAAGCQTSRSETPPAAAAASIPPPQRTPAGGVRVTGTIQAVRSAGVQVPQISGQTGRLTLVRLAPNGTRVKEGDLVAEFDRTQQLDLAREAKAKFEDFSHQVEQKKAENRSNAEKRAADLKQAEADLAKAGIQLRKGPILSEIERRKSQVRADAARKHVASLQKVDEHRRAAEAAAVRILELQMDRQKVALERAQTNAERLVLKAPISGMVSLENQWRSGSMGPAQEGDQMWRGQPLLKIFDPGEMEVLALVGEPDGAILQPGTAATIFLDAYPDARFQAHFHSASPVATSALGSPIKNFTARFRLEQNDPRLLPDLSAALVIERKGATP